MPNPTPDSILAVLLDATADIHSATMTARADIACITDELGQLPPTGFTLARTMLSQRREALADDVVTKTRAAVTIAAAKLSLRTGPDGECDIDKPAVRPKGPPTKAEKAARATAPAGDPPPAMQASTESQAFFDAVADRAPAAELETLGWTDAGEGLSDVQTRTLCKHQITPDEVNNFVFNGVIVRGVVWTMADEPRVVA
jgi:hypothetical protein